MASNFKFFFHQTRDSLHMKLWGDFDGSSAYELINALVDYGIGFYQIFIDTNDLQTIHPFGRNVFHKNFSTLGKKFDKITFIGKHKYTIAPQWSHFGIYF